MVHVSNFIPPNFSLSEFQLIPDGEHAAGEDDEAGGGGDRARTDVWDVVRARLPDILRSAPGEVVGYQ